MNVSRGTEEVTYRSFNGYMALAAAVISLISAVVTVINLAGNGTTPGIATVLWAVLSMLVFVIVVKGMYMLQPNQAALMMLFGAYRGTDFNTGLRCANPLLSRTKVSLRLRNFNTERMKVNDKRGNPIEIGAAITWRVSDTARAMLDVDHYEAYVPIQAETAIRHIASEFSYDSNEDDHEELTLRGGGDALVAKLKTELKARFDKAGLEVDDARITHLAYAPEIAGAMLRRQQAEAVISARKQIVLGAVSMVEMALDGLKQRNIIELDDERRAAMVCNLLVVLCGDNDAQPVINAGTLYN
jgi:regulator of protease activity HflC (stomatin/prohibitin superfamily)